VQLCTQFHQNRTMFRWDMAIVLAVVAPAVVWLVRAAHAVVGLAGVACAIVWLARVTHAVVWLVVAQYYFRFRIWCCHSHPNVKIYMQIKFRRRILIHCWDITISGFEKQMSATLEFFRLQLLQHHSNRRAILHQTTKLHPNRTARGDDITSYWFSIMAAAAARYYFRFRICWCHSLPKVNIYRQTMDYTDTDSYTPYSSV